MKQKERLKMFQKIGLHNEEKSDGSELRERMRVRKEREGKGSMEARK